MNQQISSKATSTKQVPKIVTYLLNHNTLHPKQIIVDYGCGKYNCTKQAILDRYDVVYVPMDKYHYSDEHNHCMTSMVHSTNGADIIILANVLNVIKEKEERIKVLNECKSLLNEQGNLFIQVYYSKSDRNPCWKSNTRYTGQKTTKGWQVHQPLHWYYPEIYEVFNTIKPIGDNMAMVY